MSAWLERSTGIVLLDVWLLWLALLIPAALWLRRRRGEPGVAFAPAFLLRPGAGSLPRSWRLRLLPLVRALQVLGLLLVVVALARPVHRVELPRAARGIDVLLCVDVSSSMAARDLDPRRTRLDVAVAAAERFVAGRPGDRIGLVRFARYPDLLCPPTLDHRAIGAFLRGLALVEADGPEDQTGIGTAVARAAQVLRGSTAPSKVAILLTDGEENVATAQAPDEIGPLRAARLCAELGVRVYTIAAGVGKRGADGALTPLDTSAVQSLAETTGGAFFAARDADAVAHVYRTIDGLEQAQFDEPRYELREVFAPFLLGALALVLVAHALRGLWLKVLP